MSRLVAQLCRTCHALVWFAAVLLLFPISANGAPSLITVTPLTADVGLLAPGQSPNVTFAVTNIAAGDVWVTWSNRAYHQQFPFFCAEPAFVGRSPYVIHPGETCTGEIGISAPLGAIGPGQTLVDFSAQSGAQVVTATVTWNAAAPPILVSPLPVALGPAQVGQSVRKTFTLTNTLDSTVAIGVDVRQGQATDCEAIYPLYFGAPGPKSEICTAQRNRPDTVFFSTFGCQNVAAHASCSVTMTFKPSISLPTYVALEVSPPAAQSTLPITEYDFTAEAIPAQTMPGTVLAVEYINRDLLHFFVTALPGEIQALDEGDFPPWVRTGRSFWVYPPGNAVAASESPVCRYFTTPDAGFNTHFYSAFPQECNALPTMFPGLWTLETMDSFGVQQPDVATGACPAGTSPLYRAYNGGPNVNHRYMANGDVRQLMITDLLNWIPEGYGPLGVGMCVPQ